MMALAVSTSTTALAAHAPTMALAWLLPCRWLRSSSRISGSSASSPASFMAHAVVRWIGRGSMISRPPPSYSVSSITISSSLLCMHVILGTGLACLSSEAEQTLTLTSGQRLRDRVGLVLPPLPYWRGLGRLSMIR
jgi:hypothetical protein